ncbi:M48 family metallopeptidase [Pontibacter sp. JAM-7]|uniref:M48 family metallopeptidase n=1 Tax=Pontibacter sp. JAM-7 TaxID=3366581 RepID=UPI003AF80E63
MPVRILGVFVLLCGCLSGCQALQRVDQGLYQVAEAVSEEDRVTGRRSLSLADRQAQIEAGNAYVEQVIAQEQKAGRGVNAQVNKVQYQRLLQVFDRVHRVSHLSEERWQPILVNNTQFNAFTTGGTYIVVFSGLMDSITDDAELAAVVAHEIAHTVANHAFERRSMSQLTALTGSNSARRSSYQAAFTHENEREADRIGILYCALAGYDPLAASRIWQRKYTEEGNARALFNHDHPVNAERYAEAKAVAEAVNPYYRKGQINPEAGSLLQNNVLWQKQQGTTAGEGGGLAALLGTALGAYVDHETAKQEEQRQAARSQFVKAVEASLKLESAQQREPHLLETRWRYQARQPVLKNVVMGLMVKRDDKLLRYVAHVEGSVNPGQVFVARFRLPDDLSVEELKKLPGKYYLDDALPR